MATKKAAEVRADLIAEARKRAEQTRRRLEHKPGPSELLTPQELADAAPFYLVLRDYIRQLKEAREAAGLTLAELSARSGLAVETLCRLETGALTNPTWKTLGAYAAALGLRPHLALETTRRDGGQDMETERPSKKAPGAGVTPGALEDDRSRGAGKPTTRPAAP